MQLRLELLQQLDEMDELSTAELLADSLGVGEVGSASLGAAAIGPVTTSNTVAAVVAHSVASDGGMLEILTAQRDRLRERLSLVESERDYGKVMIGE